MKAITQKINKNLFYNLLPMVDLENQVYLLENFF